MGDEEANREVVRRLWELFEERDWQGAGALLHEDVVVDWPWSAERIRGRDNFISVNRHHPAPDWHIEVRRIVAEGDQVVSEVIVPYEGGQSRAASFFELRDGRIARIVEYWIDHGQQEPLEYRAAWVEPLTPE
ncbi:MAG: nuclear transport factor 2 family protein [Actinomycetota bacterium]|nr:nuclear transport factor 2 family protein [Actinomycetota bacterium]